MEQELNYDVLASSDIHDLIGITPVNKAITSAIYGEDINQRNAVIPKPRIGRNRIFFTRPQLNMRAYNIINDKDFGMLVNNDVNSIGSIVRSLLDPRLAYPYQGPGSAALSDLMDEYDCPLINNYSPWMHVLSNSLNSFDGWTDLTMGRHQSANDLLKGSIEIIDDTAEINSSNSFTASFMNMETDINRLLLDVMYKWQAKVRLGLVNNYWDYELAKVKGYNTRMYSIITGPDDESIIRWASTGPSIVTNVNTNTRFAYNRAQGNTEDQADFSAEFTSFGMTFNRLDTLIDFNKATSYFHPMMATGESIRANMQRLTHNERKLFNHRAIPLVDILKMKLYWVVDRDYYNDKMAYWEKKNMLNIFENEL